MLCVCACVRMCVWARVYLNLLFKQFMRTAMLNNIKYVPFYVCLLRVFVFVLKTLNFGFTLKI